MPCAVKLFSRFAISAQPPTLWIHEFLPRRPQSPLKQRQSDSSKWHNVKMQVSGFTFHLHWQPGEVNSAPLRRRETLAVRWRDPIRQPTAVFQRAGFWDRLLCWWSKLHRALGLWLVKRSSVVFFLGWPTCLALIREPSVISNDTQEFSKPKLFNQLKSSCS